MRQARSTRQQSGFALMAALWLVVLVGATGYELSVRSRARRLAVANALESVQARAAADAALETARARLERQLRQHAAFSAGQATRLIADPLADLSGIAADTLVLGDERASLVAYDAGARLQVNLASEDDLRRFFAALPLDASVADRMAQRVLDWRDADSVRRPRGAERADYLRAGARVLPPDAELRDVQQLRDVEGMTPDLYDRIAPYLSVHGAGQINLNAAPRMVIRSLPGMSDESIDALANARQSGRPLRSLEELAPRVSSEARKALVAATAELMTRTTFEARQVVVTTDGWLAGSPVHVHAAALYTRSGDVLAITYRRVGP